MANEERPKASSGQSWIRDWASDSALLLVSQALTVFATSFAAIMIARSLEPSDWAIFSAFLGISLAFSIIVDFGLATYLLRELSALAASDRGEAQWREDAGRLAGASVSMNATLTTALVLGGGTYAILSSAGAAAGVALVCLLAYGGLTATASSLETHMRARRQVPLVVGVALLEKFVLLSLVLASFWTGASLGGIAVAYLTAGIVRVSVDGGILVRRYRLAIAFPSRATVLSVARASLPFALAAGSMNVIPRLDTFVLLTLSTSSAAWWAIGERVLGPALLVPATLGSALYPFMAARNVRRSRTWQLAGLMGLAGAAAAATGVLLAPKLVPLVFGRDYADAVPVVQVMMLVLPIIFASSPMLVSAYSNGAERSIFVPVLLISLLGTLAIVVGQVVAGAEWAAVGFVVRSLLAFLVIATVGGRAGRLKTGRETLNRSPTTAEDLS